MERKIEAIVLFPKLFIDRMPVIALDAIPHHISKSYAVEILIYSNGSNLLSYLVRKP
jgi:hypothetical protein